MTPEFHRPRAASSLDPAGETVAIAARGAERAALARRFDLPAIAHFAARFHLRPSGDGGILAEARLLARVTQVCVISLAPLAVTIDTPFLLRFVPAGREAEGDDPEAIDTIGFVETLDLGEAAAEQFALLLDPYPRAPGAVLPAEYIAPVAMTPETPFAALHPRRRG